MASNNTATTPYNLEEGAAASPYGQNNGAPSPYYTSNNYPAPIQQSRKIGGGGFCLGCSLAMILCCVLPAVGILAAYLYAKKKMNDGGFGDLSQYMNGDGEGGGWSDYLNDMDDATISGYVDQFTNGDDDTISSYISNWAGGDGGD